MAFMEWIPSFELGITQFDEHHKHLVCLLNMTCDGVTCGAEKSELEAVLDELIDYATYHFATEENWMTIHKFPGLPDHSEDHKRFVKWIVKTQQDFLNGKAMLGQEVIRFLNTWLADHILITDAEYGRFAKEADIAIT